MVCPIGVQLDPQNPSPLRTSVLFAPQYNGTSPIAEQQRCRFIVKIERSRFDLRGHYEAGLHLATLNHGLRHGEPIEES
jgi:hypothetical protein